MFVKRAVIEFEALIDFDLGIGESPVWDEARLVLWFVDILAPAVIEFDPVSRAITTHPMPAAVGSLGLCRDGRLIVALRTGVHFYDPASRKLEFLVHPEPDRPMNRLNDGKVGPDGCFWVGSMHDSTPRQATAALYRVTPDGKSSRIFDGLKVSNGLAWSPDAQTLYHADTRAPFIKAFDFDPATGSLSNGRTLAEPSEEVGLPDGAAVDGQGFYWSAGITAGRLNKFSPEGALMETIELPTPAPTMPCFGGEDGRTVYVTSLATDRRGRHEGGTLLAFRTEVAGAPITRLGDDLFLGSL